MKRKLTVVVTALIMALFTLSGCSCVSCVNCVDGCFKNVTSGILEFFGSFNKCTGCICEGFLGEECYESCFVGPCYAGANCARNCDDPNCNVLNSLIENDDVDELQESEHYSINTSYTASEVKYLSYYYSIDFTVKVTARTDLNDVIVKASVSDGLGNIQNGMLVYVADSIKADASAEATVRLTFYLPNGTRSNIEKCGFKVDSLAVYGKI